MESNEWRELTWGDISELKYGKALKGYKDKTDGVPVFGTNGKIGYTNEALAQGPGIIIGRKGAYRGVHFSENDFFVIDTAYYLKLVSSSVDIRWAYYELKSKDLNSLDSGSAIPSTKKEDFYALKVNLPPLEIQKKIAYFAHILDEKISVNNNVISKLNSLSQSIFKHWFIDFEFPDSEGRPYKSSGGKMIDSEFGSIPIEWEILRIKDLVSKFGTGLNPRKNFVLGEGDKFYVTIKNMSDGGEVILDDKCDKVTDEALMRINKRSDLRKFDVLFSGIGTIGRTHYILNEPKNWNISESIFTLRSNDRITPEFLYLLLSSKGVQDFAVSSSSGSVQKGIRKRDLEAYKVITPPINVLNNFSALTSKVFEEINTLRKQNSLLITLRDTLVPRLLSGKLELPKEFEVTTREPV